MTNIFLMSFTLLAVRGDRLLVDADLYFLIPTLEKYFFIKIVINAGDSMGNLTSQTTQRHVWLMRP